MRAREYLRHAREVVVQPDEVHWRAAVVHAYYGLFLECRDALQRWGRTLPRRDAHRQVRLTFTYAKEVDLIAIGRALDVLSSSRAHASYEMAPQPLFTTALQALQFVQLAADALALLDAIDGDAARRAAAVAALPPPIP